MLYAIFVAVGLLVGIAVTAAVLIAAWRSENDRRRKARKPTSPPADTPENKPGLKDKRRLEFGKFIVAVYAFACIGWITADYALAFMYQKPINTEVTVDLTKTVVATILGYYIKTAFEKANRNKHSLDENGAPLDTKNISA